MNSSNKIISILFLVSLTTIFACSSDKDGVELLDNKEGLTDLDEENQLLETGIQKLQEWSNHWKSIDAEFNTRDFKYARRDTIEGIERPEELHIIKGSPFYPYLQNQPDGEGTIDIYSYKIVFPEEGNPYFNPDSEVTYFKSDGMRERLLFMGPSGAFEDIVWLTSDALLVVGHFENEGGVSPKAWIIYPRKGQITQFDNPLQSRNYKRESYLTKRFTGVRLENGI